jgi:hypothetical protein
MQGSARQLTKAVHAIPSRPAISVAKSAVLTLLHSAWQSDFKPSPIESSRRWEKEI